MARDRIENDFKLANGDGNDDESGLATKDPNFELNLELESQNAELRRQRIDLDKRKTTKYKRVRVERTTNDFTSLGGLFSRFCRSLLQSGPNAR